MTLGKAILEALDAARSSDPLTAKSIYGLIANDVHPSPTLSDVDAECRQLEGRGELVRLNDDDRGFVHSITPKGQARARK